MKQALLPEIHKILVKSERNKLIKSSCKARAFTNLQ